MATINVSTARQTLPALLDRVERGEEIAMTRHGAVVAVLVRPDVLRARRAKAAWDRADEIDALLSRARREPMRPPTLDARRADELVRAIDADRTSG